MVQKDVVIDLRSDTVTKPTEEMRRAMYNAEVGDDVLGEDPTVIELESIAADMFSKEAALLTSSGSMSNLIAVLAHSNRGDEILMGSEAHMFWNEGGSASSLGGVQIRLIPNDQEGRISSDHLVNAFNERSSATFPSIPLLCLENTHNRCNGTVLTPKYTKDIVATAHNLGMRVHMDGARIFNAAVYLGVPVNNLVDDVDDISFCLSKGLSAPVGSLLCGTQKFISAARKWRKLLGGGMRQSGIIAAAGIVALRTMVTRLNDDHMSARKLAIGLSAIDGICLDSAIQQTNIVFFNLRIDSQPVDEFIQHLGNHGVKISHPGGSRLRVVTHRHITSEDIDLAIDVIKHVLKTHST